MENDWTTLFEKFHSIACDREYGRPPEAADSENGDGGEDRIEQSPTGGSVFEPKDRLDYFKAKGRELWYIVRTQGIREGVYVAYNFAKRKIFPPKRPSSGAVLKKNYNPLEWENVKLTFEKYEAPDVSIVIPVYNKWGYTYNCLKSILKTKCTCTYEIIIADDCSTDETAELETYIENVVHVRNEVNLNFLKNCNNASQYAKGKYILFLNNDTLVMEDWLQSLYDLIESDPTIGMVGSKFIYPDGSLQEAGGMVFSDATGKNYGRGDDPSKPEYNYVRDVDYISGASIMLPREIWEQLGHFDERYAPAYYEDSDLAFKVRRAGYRVVYQPRSELIHFERTSMSDNGLRLCAENRSKFLEVWKKELIHDAADEYIQRDRSKYAKRILYVDDKVPMFDQHAGGKTTFNFLQILRDSGFKVTFLGVFDSAAYQPYTGILQQMGIEVLSGYAGDDIWMWLNRNAKHYDTVFLNRPECAIIYLDWFRKNTDCQIAYYGHDLHWLREKREYDLTGDKSLLARSEKSKETEMYIMSNSDIVMSVSPDEKKIIDGELGKDKTFVTPIFFYRETDRPSFDSLEKNGLLFVGGYGHTPNVDAVRWLMDEVLPLVRARFPDIDVTLAGSHPTSWIKSLESEHVHVPGYMSDEDLDALYDRSLISIAPLRFGAGVKGKVVDAMHHGLPVVSTSIGTEGLPGVEGCISPHDDAESFAAEIIELLENPDMVRDAYEKNYRYVLDTFGYDSAMKTFEEIFGSSEKKSATDKGSISILDLTYSIECPATAGGSLRIVSPLTKISCKANLEIDMLFTTWSEEYASKMEACLTKIPTIRFAKGVVLNDYLSNKDGRPKDIPKDVWETMSIIFSDYIDTLVRQNHYDIIQIEHSQFAWMVPRIRVASPDSKIVLDAHNVEYRVYESWLPYTTEKDRAYIEEQYASLKKWEDECIPWFDAAFTVSPIEEEILKSKGIENTYLVATGGGIDPEKYAPEDDDRERPFDLLYIGSMNWFPNSQGLTWFIREVLPLIEEKRPNTSLNIVGNGTPDPGLLEICKHSSNVKFWGFQKDDVSFFHRGRVFIVPLFIGAGARVKIPTAWASKIPVVSTVFGAEGLDAVDGENIMMRDDPREYAEAVLGLLDDPALSKRISDNAFATLKEKYSIQKCADDLVRAYREISNL